MRAAAGLLLLVSLPLLRADDASAPPVTDDQAYELGKQLFDQYAPDSVKQQYDFPTKEQWHQFMGQFERALQGDSLEELARYEPQARAVLELLRLQPQNAGLANWLAARIEEVDAARRIAEEARRGPPPVPPLAPGAVRPSPPAIPYYDFWLNRLQDRPVPPEALILMPRLRAIFASEGVPPELAWLAEVESSFDPDARSPSGATGLFQLESDTAHRLGLSTFLPDERTNPEKSARAAAKNLRALHDRFGSWSLALAAYNAGEGRVSRALAVRHAHDFAEVASALPAGTRMYVPEVCALVAVRTGLRLR